MNTKKKGLRRKLKFFFAKIRWRIGSFSSDHPALKSIIYGPDVLSMSLDASTSSLQPQTCRDNEISLLEDIRPYPKTNAGLRTKRMKNKVKSAVQKRIDSFHNSKAKTRGVSRGHKAQGQGHKKKSEAKDSLSEDRHSRGQGQPFREQTLSRPRTGMLKAKDTSASALQNKKKRSWQKFFRRSQKKKKKKKKKGLHKNFSSDLHKKNVFQKIFQALHKILTIQKILLSSSRGQANFRGLEASRPWGQGQGLDLWGQGLQNVSSRTPSLAKTIKF